MRSNVLGSPYSMGIENDKDNAYWVFDGYHEHICWYDFSVDHGAGNSDHDDGKIHRYTNVRVKRKPGVPSHMVMDKPTGWLYIVDAGNNRIIRMNTKTTSKKGTLPLRSERLAEHFEMEAEYEVFADKNFDSPCGIEISNGMLFVTDNANGDIIAYDMETKKELKRLETGQSGIMGIVLGPDGKLWFTNASTSKIIRIDPN